MRERVLHVGRGDGWWWADGPVVVDGPALWWVRDDEAERVELSGVIHARGTPRGLEVTLEGGRVAEVSPGAVRVRHRDDVWESEGFLYAATGQGPVAAARLGHGKRWLAGPCGALLGGGDVWSEGAAPGRSPQPLPVSLVDEPVRFADDGRRVAGVTPLGHGVTIDLLTRRVVARRAGVPVAVDAWLGADGRVVRDGGEVLHHGVLEVSCARWERWLAGPGGVVWDLETGRRCFDTPRIALGATVGTPSGFVTVAWDTHRGHTVSFTGGVSERFELPLDPEDTVSAGVFVDGAVHLETALGERFRVSGSEVAPSDVEIPDHEPERHAIVGGRRYAWTEDGWLRAYS